MAKIYKLYEDSELTASSVVVAKFTANDRDGKPKQYIGKRECAFYPENSQKNTYANRGLVLRYQGAIRDAVKEKHGLKVVSTGGEVKDLSAIEAV